MVAGRHGLPKYGAICHAGIQEWFSLGDALPMHWDFGVNELASVVDPPLAEALPVPVSGRRGQTTERRDSDFASLGLQANLYLNDRGIDGGASCVNAGYIQHHAGWISSDKGQTELERMAGVGKQHPKMSNVPGECSEEWHGVKSDEFRTE